MTPHVQRAGHEGWGHACLAGGHGQPDPKATLPKCPFTGDARGPTLRKGMTKGRSGKLVAS